jgi:hypothetical protein
MNIQSVEQLLRYIEALEQVLMTTTFIAATAFAMVIFLMYQHFKGAKKNGSV